MAILKKKSYLKRGKEETNGDMLKNQILILADFGSSKDAFQ